MAKRGLQRKCCKRDTMAGEESPMTAKRDEAVARCTCILTFILKGKIDPKGGERSFAAPKTNGSNVHKRPHRFSLLTSDQVLHFKP